MHPLPQIGFASAPPEDEVDPDLVAMPPPRRRERTAILLVMGLAAAAALAMVVVLRHDVAYALSGSLPLSVGDLRAATALGLSRCENRLVRGEAMLGAAGGIRYERLLSNETFRALPVAGRSDVWVEVRVPPGQDNGRWEPPRSFTGHLVRFDAGGPRHRGLARAIERTAEERLPEGAFLLVDGEEPAGARWVVLLAATFLGFAVWNIAAMRSMLRKVA